MAHNGPRGSGVSSGHGDISILTLTSASGLEQILIDVDLGLRLKLGEPVLEKLLLLLAGEPSLQVFLGRCESVLIRRLHG